LKTYLNADPQMNNQNNNIVDEAYSGISSNSIMSLKHDIYFGESLSIINVTGGNVPLVIDTDYAFEEKDNIASSLAGKDCYRKIKFLRTLGNIKISYHAYGDFFKASDINKIVNEIDELNAFLLPVEKKIIKGDRVTTSFNITDFPDTAHDFEFKLNTFPLEDSDYTWSFSGTSGTLNILTFIPLLEDTIEITYRS
jgi:hypothetical protein